MSERDSDSVRHVLSGEFPVDETELRLNRFVADVFCSGYIVDSQSVREVTEYFDLRMGERLHFGPAAALREVPSVIALHERDSTPWAE